MLWLHKYYNLFTIHRTGESGSVVSPVLRSSRLHLNREIANFMHWANKLLNTCNGQLYCPFYEVDIGLHIS